MGNTASNSRNAPYYNPYNSPRHAQYQQESTEIAYPSVSEFTTKPARYPTFVLVTVLSTGKMQVMTKAEACGNRKVKIVSTANQTSSGDSGFFAQLPSDATSFQGHSGDAESVQMDYVFALDLLSGLFVVVSKCDILRQPWRYQVFNI